ncbi:MAG TPA: GNAT family N-acetyltransferase [Cellulomonas sp.]|uniref:GNAT family N-acetyltransferase n=1 Tax=Cellulomonas sp. TaxID=40001 RepID=UPI002E360C82|nr:GNAT family N-acetyltransferase [Cellulomonas sp.]HEX5332447.1 GNAT family N-acetyltransferase [Cellulomonas sp.]
MRSSAQVRAAEPDDLTSLVRLCLEARAESTVGAQLCTSDSESLRHQIGALLAAPGGVVLVATVDGSPAGLLLARLVGPTVFSDLVSLAVEAVYVARDDRRRGVGHALMAGAAEVADEGGATDVYASPLPGARGMLRFFARMGFAPAATHRVVSTASLQRRLAGEAAPGLGARRGGRAIEDLIARRRQVRAASQRDPADARMVRGSGADQVRAAAISMQVSRAVASRRASESSTTIS